MRMTAGKIVFGVVPLVAGTIGLAGTAATASGTSSPSATAVPASASVSVDVSFPLRNEAALNNLVSEQTTEGSAQYHKWLTPSQFADQFGVSASDVAAVTRQASADGLTATQIGAQAIRLSGPASNLASALSTTLQRTTSGGASTITAASAPTLSGALARAGGTVVGLQAIRMTTTAQPANRYSPYGGYWYDDLKQAYQFPAYGREISKGQANGDGSTIGIVMSSAPNISDFRAYFANEGLGQPNITVRPIDGGSPFDPNSGASLEVNLDTQQAAGMAPKAHIVVYDIPDLSDGSVFDGYVNAIESNQADVINSSFGGCELFYTAPYNNGTSETGILKSLHDLMLQANAQGITMVASSGDFGGPQCAPPSYLQGQNGKFIPGVNSPADDPDVTGVGGTNLVTTYSPPSLNSQYVRENATADTLVPFDPYGTGGNLSGGYWGSGGGFSKVFAEPSWQQGTTPNNTGERSVPDVSLHMGGCPGGISNVCNPEDSYDTEMFGGQLVGVIGTSASSPDFAGAMALYDQVHGGRSGNINPLLYQDGAAQRAGTVKFKYFHEDVPGFNGEFYTGYTQSGGTQGNYDEVIGNGTLIAKNFIFNKGNTPAAGIPRHPSNP